MDNAIQDIGKKRVNTKDQYYTKKCVAQSLIETIKKEVTNYESYQWIEPSAGNGSFYLDSCIALDIEPKHPNVIKKDFLQYINTDIDKPILIYGNPPFGKQSSLAKKFIKHAITFAEIIAFILPRSFIKPSMSKVFPLNFHCIYSKELEKDSFEVNEKSYDVPCVFQIWMKKNVKRDETKKVIPDGFSYVKCDSYDISIRRVGVYAGKAMLYQKKKPSVQSHYFIKLDDSSKKELYVKKINNHTFPSNTVGPRSLSKSEINEVLNKLMKE